MTPKEQYNEEVTTQIESKITDYIITPNVPNTSNTEVVAQDAISLYFSKKPKIKHLGSISISQK